MKPILFIVLSLVGGAAPAIAAGLENCSDLQCCVARYEKSVAAYGQVIPGTGFALDHCFRNLPEPKTREVKWLNTRCERMYTAVQGNAATQQNAAAYMAQAACQGQLGREILDGTLLIEGDEE